MAYIPLESVESSMISEIGYDRKTQTLRVLFTNGSAYDYPTFTERDWAAFQEAESVGKHFHRAIKPTFAHRRVEERQLDPPCCEHDKPDDTCDESCLPCDPSCCPGLSEAQRRQRLAAMAGGLARGQQLIESAREGAATSTFVPAEIYGPPNPPSEGEDNSDLAHTHDGKQHEHEGGDTAHTHFSEDGEAEVPPLLTCAKCHANYDPDNFAVGDFCARKDCDDGVVVDGVEKEENDGTED